MHVYQYALKKIRKERRKIKSLNGRRLPIQGRPPRHCGNSSNLSLRSKSLRCSLKSLYYSQTRDTRTIYVTNKLRCDKESLSRVPLHSEWYFLAAVFFPVGKKMLISKQTVPESEEIYRASAVQSLFKAVFFSVGFFFLFPVRNQLERRRIRRVPKGSDKWRKCWVAPTGARTHSHHKATVERREPFLVVFFFEHQISAALHRQQQHRC